jgi:hypothetical protein
MTTSFLELLTTEEQCCQIVLDTMYQNGEKHTKIYTKFPNGHKMYQML